MSMVADSLPGLLRLHFVPLPELGRLRRLGLVLSHRTGVPQAKHPKNGKSSEGCDLAGASDRNSPRRPVKRIGRMMGLSPIEAMKLKFHLLRKDQC